MKTISLRYTESGHIFIMPGDDPEAVVDTMLAVSYAEEFCIAGDFIPDFVSGLMAAGFLVMSAKLNGEPGCPDVYILCPKLHLSRSILFFPELHVKKSVRRLFPRYELRINTDFKRIIDNCVRIHGDEWLTLPLVTLIKLLYRRGVPRDRVRPVSFGLYRDGELKAGEFGIVSGRVYTSYSGYYEEDNAGTVQMILMTRYLEKAGFDFLDMGMPLDYKDDLGARNVDPAFFVEIFRKAQIYAENSFSL